MKYGYNCSAKATKSLKAICSLLNVELYFLIKLVNNKRVQRAGF